MPDTLAAITAAGIVYDRNDFADPHLPGPTALTVTADGRVYGHLAAWGTPHIGMGGRVTPPKSRTGYKYFHQGIVPTRDGDLPVGKLTLGTGHAPVDGRTDSVAAAAHYDNTGTVAAAVRAGEDQHGIWLAGRIVPGTPPERVDELRLSGVSGDWRGIDGTMELVAALAVNVPGFPVPRTEQLVAAGVPTALVAAGVVAPVQGPTVGEMEAMVASAVESAVRREVDAARAADRRRAKVAAKVTPIIASAVADRRARVLAKVQTAIAAAGGRRVRTQEGADMYGVSIGDLIPKAIEQAQTLGGQFAEAAGSDVANLIDPGRTKKATAPSASKTSAKQETIEVNTGDTKTSEPAAAKKNTTETAEPAADATSAPVTLTDTSDEGPVVDSTTPARLDEQAGTAEGAATDSGGVSVQRMEEDESPTASPDGADLLDFSDGVATYADGSWTDDGSTWHTADELRAGEAAAPDYVGTRDSGQQDEQAYIAEHPNRDAAVITTDVPARASGTGERMEEDEAPATGANGGTLTGYRDGVAQYDDGTETDGTTWYDTTMLAPTDEMTAESASEAAASDEFTAEDGLDPNVDDFGEHIDVPEPGSEVTDTEVPTRIDTGAGTDHPMEEDESPETGANGGSLVDYADGIAFYDDGTDTDGQTWRYSEPVEEPDDPEAIAASANRHARIMRTLGYRAANRRAIYPKA